MFGDLGNEGPSYRVDEKLQVLFSMCWLKKLACKDQLEFLFRPEFMPYGGTLNDFINAIRITGEGNEREDIILYLQWDWQNFLNFVTNVENLSAVHMAEINSFLSQRSLSTCN